ncbi:hypothetical protein HYPSUDRAFT_485376 [Hypholoma sublateritium FD-334 SS-4]|uniref:Uncharacterized protein n=1 Tax=Hypholoma sublateritium (strain FD-334 SS-4) TaxID=945553 RepID=A0A0D2NBA8_HYPSF|nr:hypothetical protein HYPSUDRAFT_585212 [Hypholoma sublateritium FD-334 SS-4]KJA13846.1 hypothetical protein HYPSUDRAFT_485376 [Hypholoma sublateritium FD-334 SS-4]
MRQQQQTMQNWDVFPIQIRYTSGTFTPKPDSPSGAQSPPASSSSAKTPTEPQLEPTKRDENPAIMIDNLSSQLIYTGHQLHDLSNRLNEFSRFSGEQRVNDVKTETENVGKAKAIEDKAEAKHDPNRLILEEMQALTRRLNAMETQKISDAQIQHTINARLETTISNLQQELKTEIQNSETRTKDRALEHAKQISVLESTISGLNDTVKDLVDYQMTTDPVFMVRIQIRTVVDKIRVILHNIFTGEPATERGGNVKNWWAHAINPSPSESASMTKEAVDEHRYRKCLALLADKKLESQPLYHKLVQSGSLRFLSQASINLRNQANTHAHEVGSDMTSFRKALLKTKSMHNHLCTAADFVCINGIVDFLEVLETKKGSAI